MESKWRSNVAEYGLSGGPELLVARFLPLSDGYQEFLVRRADGPYLTVYAALPGELPTYQYSLPPIGARFPGVYDVEPDGS